MSDTTAIDLHPTDPNRRRDGKFLPGSAGSSGRLKRADEQAVVSAINTALPPAKLQQALEDALEMAYEYKSPKLILAICQFAVSYQIGQPVQRSLSASGKLETLLGRLGDMTDEEFREVEASVRNSK